MLFVFYQRTKPLNFVSVVSSYRNLAIQPGLLPSCTSSTQLSLTLPTRTAPCNGSFIHCAAFPLRFTSLQFRSILFSPRSALRTARMAHSLHGTPRPRFHYTAHFACLCSNLCTCEARPFHSIALLRSIQSIPHTCLLATAPHPKTT